jgi:hypothetical protein
MYIRRDGDACHMMRTSRSNPVLLAFGLILLGIIGGISPAHRFAGTITSKISTRE